MGLRTKPGSRRVYGVGQIARSRWRCEAAVADAAKADEKGAKADEASSGKKDDEGADGKKDEAKSEAVSITKDGHVYVLQSHVDKLVGDARVDGKKTAADEAKRKADADAAKAKGDFETLAKTLQEEVDALKAKQAEREKLDLRRTIAATHKLPTELADRLKGDTEEELIADAKALAKQFGQRTAPDTEAGTGGEDRGKVVGDRPIPRAPKEGEPAPKSFDGRPMVRWNSPAARSADR